MTEQTRCPLCFGNLNRDGMTDGVLTHHDGSTYHARCLTVFRYAADLLQARMDQENICQVPQHDPRWCPRCSAVEDGLSVGIAVLYGALPKATDSSEPTS